MVGSWRFWNGFAGILLAVMMIGCAPQSRMAPIENVACHYTFSGVENQAERDRIAAAVKKYAKDGINHPRADLNSSAPEYMFVVDHLSALDRLHAELLYGDPAGGPASQQRLNVRGPSFGIHYESANLGAALEVIVHFHVTPGVALFYKPQGEPERDISNMIDNAGDVTLKTMIHKGEDFIYARINSGKIDKYIRINIYTQQVESIPSGAY